MRTIRTTTPRRPPVLEVLESIIDGIKDGFFMLNVAEAFP